MNKAWFTADGRICIESLGELTTHWLIRPHEIRTLVQRLEAVRVTLVSGESGEWAFDSEAEAIEFEALLVSMTAILAT